MLLWHSFHFYYSYHTKIIKELKKRKLLFKQTDNEAEHKREALEAENESEKILEHEKGVN